MNMMTVFNMFLSILTKLFSRESLPFCVIFLSFILIALLINLYNLNLKVIELERLIEITNHYDAKKQLEKKQNDPSDLKRNDIIKFEAVCEVKRYNFCAEFRAEF